MGKACNIVERLCIKKIVYLENLADYHEEQFTDSEHDHNEKATQLQSIAREVRNAVASVTLGI